MAVSGMGMSAFAAEESVGEAPIFEYTSGDFSANVPLETLQYLSASDEAALNEKMVAYVPSEDSMLKNKAESFYYYEHLDGLSREMYDIMLQVAADPTDEGNVGFMMTDLDPSGDEFHELFSMAYRALCFDHPELFWLYSMEETSIGYYSQAVPMNGFYYVYFCVTDLYDAFETVMTEFYEAADDFLADIDTSVSEYDIVRQIHDKLIDLVNYNDPVCNQIQVGNSQDLGHTAYGALVKDSSGIANYPVCDGYSLAFEYLLQQCGINVAFIGGYGGGTEETAGGHAWNIVEVDGEWYEVDCTWDDQRNALDDVAEESAEYLYWSEALDDPYYGELAEHYLFLISTDLMTHFPSGEEYEYTTQDQMYLINLCPECVHLRMGYDGDESYDASIMQLAPVATANFQ